MGLERWERKVGKFLPSLVLHMELYIHCGANLCITSIKQEIITSIDEKAEH